MFLLSPRTGWPIWWRIWVGLTWIWGVLLAGGRYCSYTLPKQDGGTSQIKVNPTQVRHQMGHPVSLRIIFNFTVANTTRALLASGWLSPCWRYSCLQLLSPKKSREKAIITGGTQICQLPRMLKTMPMLRQMLLSETQGHILKKSTRPEEKSGRGEVTRHETAVELFTHPFPYLCNMLMNPETIWAPGSPDLIWFIEWHDFPQCVLEYVGFFSDFIFNINKFSRNPTSKPAPLLWSGECLRRRIKSSPLSHAKNIVLNQRNCNDWVTATLCLDVGMPGDSLMLKIKSKRNPICNKTNLVQSHD